MKIYAYLRVSTDQQAESGAGLSAQLDACQKWAVSQQLSIDRVFAEEGVSGAAELDKRPALMELISVLKRGDVLLVGKWDRIGRAELAVAAIESLVQGKGAKIMSAAGEGTEDTDELSSFIKRKMVKFFAEYERMVIKTRTKAAMQAKKAKGERVGHIPFGYRLAENGVHLLLDEHEQSILKQIGDLMKDGLSTRKIADEMNRREAFNRGGAKWNHASIHRAATKIAA